MPNDNMTTAHKQSMSEQVISFATDAFLAKGIKAVKMDDIANSLQISKRTLYELFTTKEELLLECVKKSHEDFKKHMDMFVKEDTSVIAIAIETFRYQMAKINSVSPAYYYDIRKYHSVSKWMDKERKESRSVAMEFFQKGISEGYFRSDLDFELINKVNRATMDYIMENQFLKQYSMKQIFKNVILSSVRSLCTLKGIKALEKYNL